VQHMSRDRSRGAQSPDVHLNRGVRPPSMRRSGERTYRDGSWIGACERAR